MGEAYDGKALGDGNALASPDFLTFENAAGDVIMGFTSSRLTITVDKKTGEFKKATLTSLSGELLLDGFTGSVFNETPAPIVGGYTVKGSSVPQDKVPAEARALVAESAARWPP